ncbi:hypothetical protein FNF27_04793 [Cafeteria roenbergensis]|uniref:Uncharacterized protein n=2 Tax=Cafeteria roenbergensis TaxID=33653 RepID=A0A5A8E770_CAFRO|nr:hypothetical protein FNF27_04793 [Cafeteria roenbergensis]
MAALAAKSPLEGDGVIENLYEYLWEKDNLDRGPMGVRVPDTVVFKLRSPVAWYFTSAKDGTIKRKRKANLTMENIEEGFLSGLGSCGVAAYFIDTKSKSADGPLIEYFDEEGLREFLRFRRKPLSGILQRFVEPKGGKNSMLRAVWAPKLCLCERRENTKRLWDTRYSIFERTVTFEGKPHNSVLTPVRGSALPRQVQGVCESVVFHVAQVTSLRSRISRLVMSLKTDAKGRLWVLWASSIRTEGARPKVASADAVMGSAHAGGAGGAGGAAAHPTLAQATRTGLAAPPSIMGPLSLTQELSIPSKRQSDLAGLTPVLAPGLQPQGASAGKPARRAAAAAAAGAGAAAREQRRAPPVPRRSFSRQGSEVLERERRASSWDPAGEEAALAAATWNDDASVGEEDEHPRLGFGGDGDAFFGGGDGSGRAEEEDEGGPDAEPPTPRTAALADLLGIDEGLAEDGDGDGDGDGEEDSDGDGEGGGRLGQSGGGKDRGRGGRRRRRRASLVLDNAAMQEVAEAGDAKPPRHRKHSGGRAGRGGTTAAAQAAAEAGAEADRVAMLSPLRNQGTGVVAGLSASRLMRDTAGLPLLGERQCPSCGAAMAGPRATGPVAGRSTSLRHKPGFGVQYKTAIQHYNALLDELGLDAWWQVDGSVPEDEDAGEEGEGGAASELEVLGASAIRDQAGNRQSFGTRTPSVRSMRTADAGGVNLPPPVADCPPERMWPQQTDLVLSAAGGVGLYGVLPASSGDGHGDGDSTYSPSSHRGGSQVSREDSLRQRPSASPAPVHPIPQLLRLVHPALPCSDYRWYQRDPLFLFKSANVCEGCFLVYAKFAQSITEGKPASFALRQCMGVRAANRVNRALLAGVLPGRKDTGAGNAADVRARERKGIRSMQEEATRKLKQFSSASAELPSKSAGGEKKAGPRDKRQGRHRDAFSEFFASQPAPPSLPPVADTAAQAMRQASPRMGAGLGTASASAISATGGERPWLGPGGSAPDLPSQQGRHGTSGSWAARSTGIAAAPGTREAAAFPVVVTSEASTGMPSRGGPPRSSHALSATGSLIAAPGHGTGQPQTASAAFGMAHGLMGSSASLAASGAGGDAAGGHRVQRSPMRSRPGGAVPIGERRPFNNHFGPGSTAHIEHQMLAELPGLSRSDTDPAPGTRVPGGSARRRGKSRSSAMPKTSPFFSSVALPEDPREKSRQRRARQLARSKRDLARLEDERKGKESSGWSTGADESAKSARHGGAGGGTARSSGRRAGASLSLAERYGDRYDAEAVAAGTATQGGIAASKAAADAEEASRDSRLTPAQEASARHRKFLEETKQAVEAQQHKSDQLIELLGYNPVQDEAARVIQEAARKRREAEALKQSTRQALVAPGSAEDLTSPGPDAAT